MTTWSTRDAQALTAPEEVQVSTRRPDGSLRRPTTIWVVGHGDRVFIRSTNGRDAAWFRAAVAAVGGRLTSRGTSHDVRFTEVTGPDLDLVDAGYRAKYGRYASIVDHLEGPGPRAATLEVHPA